MADVLDFTKMKVADLKKELKERGLPLTGTKSELLDRLKSATSSTADPDALLEETDESIDLNNSNVLPTDKTEEKHNVTSVPAAKTPSKKTDPPKEEPVKEEEEHHEHVKISLSSPTDSERLKKRAERFGVVNEDIRKQQRAERFGVQSTTTTTGAGKLSTAGAGGNIDRLKKRAERFGQVVSSSLSKVDEDERIKKRKERFGDVTTATNNTTPSKFAKITPISTDDAEKKKKRAERFGIV